MAKKSSIEKNQHRKKLIQQYCPKRTALKEKIANKETSFEERFEAVLTLSQLPRNSSPTRYRNRCNFSGRPRGYYRLFGLSRIALRDFSSVGHIPGVTKSSW